MLSYGDNSYGDGLIGFTILVNLHSSISVENSSVFPRSVKPTTKSRVFASYKRKAGYLSDFKHARDNITGVNFS